MKQSRGDTMRSPGTSDSSTSRKMDRDRRRERRGRNLFIDTTKPTVEFENVLFFKKAGSETPASKSSVAGTILHDVQPRVKRRKK